VRLCLEQTYLPRVEAWEIGERLVPLYKVSWTNEAEITAAHVELVHPGARLVSLEVEKPE
jgi:hypothetical protein